MKMNKNNWRKKRFESFVFNISERVEPGDTKLDKYVGLEHIDSGKIKIERFGSPEDVVGTKLKVYNGDIIFGKRRAYQRKAAVAHFDGICSAHASVLRPNEKEVLKDFLPYFLHSDVFMNRAIEISEGSLSPTIKWKKLAIQEFLLPSIEDQEGITVLFNYLEGSIEQLEKQEAQMRKLCKFLIDDFIGELPTFGNMLNEINLKKVKYCDVVDKIMRRIDPINYGLEKIVAGENLESEDFKIRTWGTVGKDFLGPAFHVLFKPGDILYGSRRTYLRKVALAHFEGVCANTTYVIRAKENILLQDLLKHIMLSERFTQYSIGVSKGSTNPYINWKDLDNFSFQIPNTETQKKMVDILDNILDVAEKSKNQKETIKKLKQKLLNEILG